jgi:hypothetical protein
LRSAAPLAAEIDGPRRALITVSVMMASVTEQAAMIAYNNDFKLMMLLSLAAIPLVFLLRKGGGARAEPIHIE